MAYIYLVFFTLLVAYKAAKIITQIITLIKISPALMLFLLGLKRHTSVGAVQIGEGVYPGIPTYALVYFYVVPWR